MFFIIVYFIVQTASQTLYNNCIYITCIIITSHTYFISLNVFTKFKISKVTRAFN